jgi:N-acetylglucosamine kinase-like BadF-type ATPase
VKYVIGVDQGGSGTRAVVCSLDGKILGVGNGPGACHIFTGMDVAMKATQIAVEGAKAMAGISYEKALAFAGGYTGADWPDEYDLLREAIEKLNIAKRVTIVNDCIVALRGGTEKSYGAILVAGSGANCAVRAPDGREYIYHYYHDDHLQGGSALADAALKAIYRAETGRPPQTSLRERVLSYLDLPNVDALMRGRVEGDISGDEVLDIAPLVFEAAENGDQAAVNIITNFGVGCAELLVNGIQRLGMGSLDIEIVLSGGVFKAKSPLLRDILTRDVNKAVLGANFIEARYEPVVGAVLLAVEISHHPLDLTLKNIENTARRFSLLRMNR